MSIRDDFVTAVKEVVYDSAVSSTESLLREPPGRAPSPALVALSEWFLNLDEADRDNVIKVAQLSADLTAFGLICVTDGSRRAIKGVEYIRLEAVSPTGVREEIFDGDYSLHDEYRSLVSPFGIT